MGTRFQPPVPSPKDPGVSTSRIRHPCRLALRILSSPDPRLIRKYLVQAHFSRPCHSSLLSQTGLGSRAAASDMRATCLYTS